MFSSNLPKGEMIVRGAIHFPEYSEGGSMHFESGIALVGGFHVASQCYFVFGEEEFDTLRPSDVDDSMVKFFKESPTEVFYCGQSKDIIRHYRKELNFASGLAGSDVRVPFYKNLDKTQARYIIWSKIQDEKLKYINGGIIHNCINRFAVAKNDFPASAKALVCLLNSIERSLYNDDRFDKCL